MAPEAADNLVSMCFFQVSLSSRNTPKYFTQLACFILQSLICEKIFSLVLVKNKKLVLFTFKNSTWFANSLHFYGTTYVKTLSSAYNVVLKLEQLDKSLI